MFRKIFIILSVLIAAIFLISCSLSEDSSRGSELEGAVDPCGDDPRIIDILEPLEFVRNTGKPFTEEREFTAPFPGDFCLVVVNGDHGPPHGERISSAVISIDGEQVIGPDPFNQNVGLVTESVHLEQGQHVLGVQLRSKPGSKLTVAIRGIPGDLDPPVIDIASPLNGHESSKDETGLVAGTVFDESGVSKVEIFSDVYLVEAYVESDGTFFAEVPLELPNNDQVVLSNLFTVEATDIVGNKSEREVRFDTSVEYMPGQIIVSFARATPKEEVLQLRDQLGATTGYYIREANQYQFLLPEGMSEETAIQTVSQSTFVKSADFHYIQSAAINDPLFDVWATSLNQESLQIIGLLNVWGIARGDKSLTIAVVDSGVDYMHQDLNMNIFINQGEIPLDLLVDTDDDEVITMYDLNHSDNLGAVDDRNNNGIIDGGDLVDGNIHTDVGFEGETDPGLDWCPGLCGVDDDGDGASDLEDLEVQKADYDNDRIPLYGPDEILQSEYLNGVIHVGGDDDAEDLVLARKDDDENGYADDIIGYDFGCDPGEGGTCGVDTEDNNPMDHNSHGTSVAGIIAAETNNYIGVAGINWKARILPVRIGKGDSGKWVGWGEAFDYISTLARNRLNNIRVANISGGYLSDTHHVPGESNTISTMDSVGILLVAAAGNDDTYTDVRPHYPASHTNRNIISVAAIDDDNEATGYFFDSNRGVVSVDIAAHGSHDALDPVVVTTATGFGWLCYEPFLPPWIPICEFCFGRNCYTEFYGTSAAAPHVSGVAGLLFGLNPDLSHLQVKKAIEDGSKYVGSLNNVCKTSGRLDANGAVDEALEYETVPKFDRFADNSPSISGDGRFVVYASGNEEGKPKIWIVGTDRTNPAPLTFPPHFSESSSCWHPSISSDGKKVAFVSDDDGDFEIYVVELDDNGDFVEKIQITNNDGFQDLDPFISPNGELVVYASEDSIWGDFDIFVMNSSGQGEREDLSSIPHYYSPDDRYPSISSDGSRAVWIRKRRFPNGSSEYVSTTNWEELPFPNIGVITGLKISRDGSKVIASIFNPSNEEYCGIFSINFNGTGLRQIAPCEYVPVNSGVHLGSHYFSSTDDSGLIVPFLRNARHLSDYGVAVLPIPNVFYHTIFSRFEVEPIFLACGSAPNGKNPPYRNHEPCHYSVSDDGSKIAFTGSKIIETVPLDDVGGSSGLEEWITDEDIYVINIDGSGLLRLTNQ